MPDDDRRDLAGPETGFHVLAAWRLADGGAYVYSATTLSTSSAAAEHWARSQMLVHHEDRGEPDVVSVMTAGEWEQAVVDVRRKIGE